MTAKLLSGEEVGDKVQLEILAELESLRKKTEKVPGLAVIVVGENPASLSSAYSKEELGKKLGLYTKVHRLPPAVSMEEICTVIRRLNSEEQIHGLSCQLPLPRHLSEKVILTTIASDKDVGGMHPLNAGKLLSEAGGYLPCSAYGCLQALEFTKQPVYGKMAVVLGYSNIVGKPLALLLLRRNATVTFCPTLTGDLPEICRSADILIIEAGKPGLVRGDWIKPEAVVIDAGATRRGETLAGDVVLEEAVQVAGWVFSLPAEEAGSLTQTMLMKNTLKAFKKSVIQ